MSAPTIAAIATGPSAGGIGVLRLSGPLALEAARSILKVSPDPVKPRFAHKVEWSSLKKETLDEGLLLYFPSPNSYTGEDVVELQGHGSPRLLQWALEELLKTPGVRLALPGEFTQRAFLNGRLDLARAEAVADLIAADSEAAVRSAAAQLQGSLSGLVKETRQTLMAVRTDVEAVIDFPDEAVGADAGLAARLAALRKPLEKLLEHAAQARFSRLGARVVLYGPANAGKSSLLNALLGEARALVDEAPGTTRDIVEAAVEWNGLKLVWVDTAGLRSTEERVERLGIAKAHGELGRCDLAVLLIPPGLSPAEADAAWALSEGKCRLKVYSKADLLPEEDVPGEARLQVSALTGRGMEALRAGVLATLGISQIEATVAVSARHREALSRSVEALARAELALQHSTLEVVAGELGLATYALGEITGENAPAELVDAIFSKFCIGK